VFKQEKGALSLENVGCRDLHFPSSERPFDAYAASGLLAWHRDRDRRANRIKTLKNTGLGKLPIS
jgi:hypothetical protein